MGISIAHNPPLPIKSNLKPRDKVIAVKGMDFNKVRVDPGNKNNYRIYTVRAVDTVIYLYQVGIPFSLEGKPILNNRSIRDPEYMFWEDYVIKCYD